MATPTPDFLSNSRSTAAHPFADQGGSDNTDLSDGSDLTFRDAWHSVRSGTPEGGLIMLSWEPGTITDYEDFNTINLRFQCTNELAGDGDSRFFVVLQIDGYEYGFYNQVPGDLYVSLGLDEIIDVTLTLDTTYGDPSAPPLSDIPSLGCLVGLRRQYAPGSLGVDSDIAIRVYELTVGAGAPATNPENWAINDLAGWSSPAYCGPWLGDDESDVPVGRAVMLTESSQHDSPAGMAYSLAALNAYMNGTSLPGAQAGYSDDADDWTYGYAGSTAAGASVGVTTHIGNSFTTFDVSADMDAEAWHLQAYPSGWTPPSAPSGGHVEYDGPTEPYLVAGHIELICQLNANTLRSPGFTAQADMRLWQYRATSDGHVDTSVARSLLDYRSHSWVTSLPSPYGVTLDLSGDDLTDGIIVAPVAQPTGSWAFSSAVQGSFDRIELAVAVTIDLANSYYTWHYPKYRICYPPAYNGGDDEGWNVGSTRIHRG